MKPRNKQSSHTFFSYETVKQAELTHNANMHMNWFSYRHLSITNATVNFSILKVSIITKIAKMLMIHSVF